MKLKDLLEQNKELFSEVIKGIRSKPTLLLDLTAQNKEFQTVNIQHPEKFEDYILQQQQKHHVEFSIGKYNENRTIYNHSDVYQGEERRSVHMAIDLWAEDNTPVFCPYPGVVHSFADNNQVGDFGPTIILEHVLEGTRFYTLYGHLTHDSIETLKVGQRISQGEEFCRIGGYPINGNWPPHLHFQIISDMGNRFGDHPGVCKVSDRNRFLELCPDPNLILQIPLLERD